MPFFRLSVVTTHQLHISYKPVW